MDKQRYEYYNGSTTIIDNELDTYVEDVVDRLNTQDFNKNELLKVKQRLESKIADLEAKLAESEKKARTYAKEIVFLDKKLKNLNKEFELAQEHNEKTVEYWQNECSQLKKQLAKRKREIEELKKCGDIDHFHSLLEEQKKEKLIFMNNCEELLQSQNQTAIAELEKVKKLMLEISIKNYITDEPFVKLYREDFDIIIDQQIKSLKGEK